MAGFLFQWVRGLFRQPGGKRRQRRPTKPSRRDTHLFLEPLEDRRLFSLNVWMPQRLNPVGAVGQNNQALQLFQPAGADLGTQTGVNSGNISMAASISLVDTGAYSLSLTQTGSITGGGTFTFTESGPLTFSLSEQGTQGASGYAISSVVLTQTASLHWSYVQTNSMGMTVSNQSGTYAFATTSLGTTVLDPFFWDGMNWSDPTTKLTQDRNVMLWMGNSTITVSETGGSESYTFRVNNGAETITGGNNSTPAGDMLQGGQESYAFSNTGTYSFSNQGADTFTLWEQGTASTHTYSLTSVAYSETGNGAGGQSLGYGFQFTEGGTISQTGTATLWSNQSASAHSVSLGGNSNASVQFTNNLTYSYSESGSQASYTITEQGGYSFGYFNLSSVAFNSQGNGSYAFGSTGSNTSTGTTASTDYANSTANFGSGPNLDRLINTMTDTNNGTFSALTTSTYTESNTPTFSLSEQGSYNHGCFSLGTVTVTEGGSGSCSFQQTDSYSATITGTLSQTGNVSVNFGDGALTGGIYTSGADTDNAVVTGSYTLQNSSADTLSRSGAMSFSLSVTGSDSATGTISLSSYALSSGQGYSFSLSTSSSSSENILWHSQESGTNIGNVSGAYGSTTSAGVGNESFSSASTYIYTSQTSFTSSDAGSENDSTYQGGNFAAGSYALSSVNLSQSSSETWSASGGDHYTLDGGTQTVLSGSNLGTYNSALGGSNFLNLGSGSSNETIQTTSGGIWGDSYSQTGNTSTSSQQMGSYAGGSFAYNTVTYQGNSSEADTYQSSGWQGNNVHSTSSYTSSSNESDTSAGPGSSGVNVGSYVDSGFNDSHAGECVAWSLTSTTSSSYSVYEAGSITSAGTYSLSSVAYYQTSSDTLNLQQTDTANTSGTDSYTSTGSGSQGAASFNASSGNAMTNSSSYSQTSTDTYSGTSIDTTTESDNDHMVLSEAGSFANLSFNLSSVSYLASSIQNSSDQLSGNTASTATVAYSSAYSQSMAGTAALGSSNGGGTNVMSQSSQNNYVQTAADTCTQGSSALASSVLEEAGTFSGDSYALSSVIYNQIGSDSSSSSDAQQNSVAGTDSTTTTMSNSMSGTAVLGLQTGFMSVSNSSGSYYADTYNNADSTAVSDSSTSSFSQAEQGTYSNLSYAFSSWVYGTGGNQTTSSSSSSSSNYTATGNDSSTASSLQSSTANMGGFSSMSTQTSFNSNSADTYSQMGSTAATQSSSASSNYTLYEAGGFSLESYNLSSFAYSTGGSQSQGSVQLDSAADSGTDSSTSAGTITQTTTGSSSAPIMAAYGSYSGQNTYTSSHSASDTYADSSGDTITSSGSAGASFSEQGTYDPLNGYSFASVLYQSSSAFNASVQSFASDTYSQTASDGLFTTTASASSGTFALTTSGSLASSSSSAQTSSYTSGTDTSSNSEVISSSDSMYQAGSYGGGLYAFSSVAMTSSNNDNVNAQQVSTSNQSGASSFSNTNFSSSSFTSSANGCSSIGSSSSNSSSSSVNSYTQASAMTLTQSGWNASSVSQQGTFGAGSYAFGSVVYQYQSGGNSSSQSLATDNYSGSGSYASSGSASSNSNSTTTSGSSSLPSFSFASLMCFIVPATTSANGTSSSSNQSSTAQSASGSYTQSGSDTLTSSDVLSANCNMYQAGSFSLGSYSLSSVTVSDTSSETVASQNDGQITQTGTSAQSVSTGVTASYSNTSAWGGGSNSNSQATMQSTSEAFTQSSMSTLVQNNSTNSNLFEQGTYASGSYSFSNVVFSSQQYASQTSLQSANDVYTQASQSTLTQSTSAASSYSNTTAGNANNNSGGQTITNSNIRTGQDALSTSSLSGSTTTFYGSGSYSGASGDYNLTSVTYYSSAASSFAASQASSFTDVGTATNSQTGNNSFTNSAFDGLAVSTNQGSFGGSQSSAETYVRTNQQSQAQSNSSSSSFSQQGTYAGGSYAFASVLFQASTNTSTAQQMASTNTSTMTVVQGQSGSGGNSGNSLLGLFSSGGGGSSSNSSLSTATISSTGGSSNSSSTATGNNLYESGAYSGGNYALSSVVYNETNADTLNALQSTQLTESSNQSSSQTAAPSSSQSTYALGGAVTVAYGISSGGSSSGSTQGSATDDISSANDSYDSSSLHEEGSMGASGAFSLSSVAYSSVGSSNYSRSEAQTQTSLQTSVSSGSSSSNNSGVNPAVGNSSQSNDTTTVVVSSSGSGGSSAGATFAYNVSESGNYSGGSFAFSSVVFTENVAFNSNSSTDNTSTASSNTGSQGSFALGGTTVFSGNTGDSGTENATETSSSSQSGNVAIYQDGSYSGYSYSLSSFNITASLNSQSSDVQTQNGSDNVSGTNASGTFSGSGVNSFYQSKSQTQSSNISELGTYGGGSLSLSTVTLAVSGSSNYSYNRSNIRSVSGSYNASDTTLISSSASGNYTANGTGSYGGGALSLSCFSLAGGSSGNYSLNQSGVAAGVTYSHTDSWSKSSTLNEQGSYQAPSNPQSPPAGNGWNFSSYSSTQNFSEQATDQVGNSLAWMSVTNASTVTGSGTTGTMEQTGQGSYNWNGRGYSFGPYTTSSQVTLQGPQIASLSPEAGILGWVNGATGTVNQVGMALLALLGASGAGAGVGLGPPPTPGIITLSGYGGWLLALNGPNGLTPALGQTVWGFLQQSQSNFGAVLGNSVNDTITKTNNSGQMNAFGMGATAAWEQATNGVPNGVAVVPDWGAIWGAVKDFAWGFLDSLTAGLTARLRNFISTGLSYVGMGFLSDALVFQVDTSSGAYAAGTTVGMAANIVLSFVPGVAALQGLQNLQRALRTVNRVQMAGGILNGIDAVQDGQYGQAALTIAGALCAGLRGSSTCATGSAVSRALTSVLGSSLASAVGTLATWGQSAVSVISGLRGVGTAMSQFSNGDILGGLLSLGQSAADFYAASRACFTGDTRILTQGGWVRMDELTEADSVASCDEHDPFGKIEFKPVLEVYHFPPARIWHVHVKGKVIRTTAEHPFYVWGKGWMAARELTPGDRLRSDVGRMVAVEEVFDTGVEEPVYNCAVADYHTYFVGDEDWGFSVWAHNACNLNNNGARSKFGVYEIRIKGSLYKVGKADMNRVTQSSGLPTRLHQQVRKLSEIFGARNVTYALQPLGRTTTRLAKVAENNRLQTIYDQTGVIPPGNIKSFVPQMPIPQ
jgi:hypothetical protein